MNRYAVYRPKAGEWWCGGNRWSASDAAARWFESVAVAERAALRDLPDPRTEWVVKAITSARVDGPNARRTS